MANILVVDDEDDIRYVLTLLLKQEGYGVLEAADGKTALEILKTSAVDMVLLDIILPDVSGIQVLKEIKRQYEKMPVLMISGYGDINLAVESLKEGALDYVAKPFDNEKLLDTIARIMERASSIKEKGLLRSRLMKALLGAGEKKEEFDLPKKRNYKKIFLLTAVLAVLAYFAADIARNFLSDSFDLIYTHPSGVAFRKGDFYIADWYTKNIYVHKIFPEFRIRNVFPLKNTVPFGITLENEYLWVCDNWEKKVVRLKLETMEFVSEYDLPGQNPAGIAFDGKFLWISDINLKRITKHKIDDTLSIEKEYKFDTLSPIALFWKDRTLWSADEKTGIISKHRLDGTLSVEKAYLPSEFASGEFQMLSAGSDGRHIYCLTVSGNRGRIIRQTKKTLLETYAPR